MQMRQSVTDKTVCLPFYQSQNRTFDIIFNRGYDIRKKTRGD